MSLKLEVSDSIIWSEAEDEKSINIIFLDGNEKIYKIKGIAATVFKKLTEGSETTEMIDFLNANFPNKDPSLTAENFITKFISDLKKNGILI